MATFPSYLKILRDNLSETLPNNVIRSSMDVGPDKTRKRGSSGTGSISFFMKLNNEETSIIDNFYNQNCALSFDFEHPRTKKMCRAKFTNPPVYTLNETLWDVNIKLEILP